MIERIRPCDDSKGTHVRSKRQRISRASAPHELKAKMDICTAKEEPQQSIPYATMVESKLLGEMATVMAIQINDDLLKSGDVARAPKDTTASDPLRKEPSRTPSASTINRGNYSMISGSAQPSHTKWKPTTASQPHFPTSAGNPHPSPSTVQCTPTAIPLTSSALNGSSPPLATPGGVLGGKPQTMIPVGMVTLQKKKKKQRRKRIFWTTCEETHLRLGVREFGVGKWAKILQKYTSIFKNRTSVDLKDKWRNISKKNPERLPRSVVGSVSSIDPSIKWWPMGVQDLKTQQNMPPTAVQAPAIVNHIGGEKSKTTSQAKNQTAQSSSLNLSRVVQNHGARNPYHSTRFPFPNLKTNFSSMPTATPTAPIVKMSTAPVKSISGVSADSKPLQRLEGANTAAMFTSATATPLRSTAPATKSPVRKQAQAAARQLEAARRLKSMPQLTAHSLVTAQQLAAVARPFATIQQLAAAAQLSTLPATTSFSASAQRLSTAPLTTAKPITTKPLGISQSLPSAVAKPMSTQPSKPPTAVPLGFPLFSKANNAAAFSSAHSVHSGNVPAVPVKREFPINQSAILFGHSN
ncbi:hypothetical protein AAMO2058_000381900 [Amorphochlora amoebiformis]